MLKGMWILFGLLAGVVGPGSSLLQSPNVSASMSYLLSLVVRHIIIILLMHRSSQKTKNRQTTMDFDADRIYYSHQNLHQQQNGDGRPEQQQTGSRLEDEEERAVDSDALRRHFREFLRKLAHVMCFL